MTNSVRDGSEILLEYRIRLGNGRIVEEGVGDDALHIKVGDGALPESVESALLGMRPEESQIVMVSAEDSAFGAHDSERVIWLPRSEFGDSVDPEAGALIGFSLPSGEEVAGRVISLHDERVEVDFNHPLIGHDVLFEVKVTEILETP